MAKKTVKAGKSSASAEEGPTGPATAELGGEDYGEDHLGEGKEDEGPEHEYEILEHGTIIGDLHFPLQDTDKKKFKNEADRWIVKLTHRAAQVQQLGGIRLRRRE